MVIAPLSVQAQWNVDAMLATNTDWFAHQCYSQSSQNKVLTFMAVGDNKLFQFILWRNKLTGEYEPSAMYDLDHKDGQWKVAGEQAFGRGNEIIKEIYSLDFRLFTREQFAKIVRAEAQEMCVD